MHNIFIYSFMILLFILVQKNIQIKTPTTEFINS